MTSTLAPPVVDAECPVCKFQFEANEIIPKVLWCGHSTCIMCITRIWTTNFDDAKHHVHCPVCKRSSKVPAAGIRGIPTNYSLLGTVTSLNEERKRKSKYHESCAECQKVDLKTDMHFCSCSQNKLGIDFCQRVVQREIDFELPSVLICSTCAIRKHMGADHRLTEYKSLMKIIETAVKMVKISAAHKEVSTAIENIEKKMQAIVSQLAKTKTSYDKLFGALEPRSFENWPYETLEKPEEEMVDIKRCIEKVDDVIEELAKKLPVPSTTIQPPSNQSV